MSGVIQFTLGFIFSANMETVYLLRKKRPDWQRGLLNGVGGKKEAGESFQDCMAREAIEEVGSSGLWTNYAEMTGVDFVCRVYYLVLAPGDSPPEMREDEAVEAVSVAEVTAMRGQMLPHLPCLIGAALSHFSQPKKFSLEMRYHD